MSQHPFHMLLEAAKYLERHEVDNQRRQQDDEEERRAVEIAVDALWLASRGTSQQPQRQPQQQPSTSRINAPHQQISAAQQSSTPQQQPRPLQQQTVFITSTAGESLPGARLSGSQHSTTSTTNNTATAIATFAIPQLPIKQQQQIKKETTTTAAVGLAVPSIPSSSQHHQSRVLFNSFDIINAGASSSSTSSSSSGGLVIDERAVGSKGTDHPSTSKRKQPPLVFRAGTREVHNKLEKHRRAHLKECFDHLKKQLPLNQDEKKVSNLTILHSAHKHIQHLKRTERELEREHDRQVRRKVALQTRLAMLRRVAGGSSSAISSGVPQQGSADHAGASSVSSSSSAGVSLSACVATSSSVLSSNTVKYESVDYSTTATGVPHQPQPSTSRSGSNVMAVTIDQSTIPQHHQQVVLTLHTPPSSGQQQPQQLRQLPNSSSSSSNSLMLGKRDRRTTFIHNSSSNLQRARTNFSNNISNASSKIMTGATELIMTKSHGNTPTRMTSNIATAGSTISVADSTTGSSTNESAATAAASTTTATTTTRIVPIPLLPNSNRSATTQYSVATSRQIAHQNQQQQHPVQTTALSVLPVGYPMSQGLVVQKLAIVPTKGLADLTLSATHFITTSNSNNSNSGNGAPNAISGGGGGGSQSQLNGKVVPVPTAQFVNAQYVVKPAAVVVVSRPS